jgi:hypothetical protein
MLIAALPAAAQTGPSAVRSANTTITAQPVTARGQTVTTINAPPVTVSAQTVLARGEQPKTRLVLVDAHSAFGSGQRVRIPQIGGAPGTLVLAGDELTGEAAQQISEDLAIMSRILQKAAGKGTRHPFTWVAPNALHFGRDLDAIYLTGYGALFLLSVDFPLVPPSEPVEKASKATDPTWERTRHELSSGGAGARFEWRSSLKPLLFDAGDPREYRESRLKELREQLIEAFRHAANIRGLRPEDELAIAVTGPVAGPSDAESYENGDTGEFDLSGGFAVVRGAGAGVPTSVLTLRVRKSDVDAFAVKELSPGEFAGRVKVSLR